MNKILIADAGATKTCWVIARDWTALEDIETQGISPIHQSSEEITSVIMGMKEQLQNMPDEVYFYGAGCVPDKIPMMESILKEIFGEIPIEVNSDLLGAARATCRTRAGITCMLGTGSGSCYYDGVKIVQSTPSLGYILGDEGSGSVMGRTFLSDLLKGVLSTSLKEDFFKETRLTQAEIIENVYCRPLAARYLASMAPKIALFREREEVHHFIVNHFRNFIVRNVQPYNHPELPLFCVGGIAVAFLPELQEAAYLEKRIIGPTLQTPLAGLIQYHY